MRKKREKKRKKEESIMNCQLKKVLTFLVLLYFLGKNYSSNSNDINNEKKKGYLGKTFSLSNNEINNGKKK